MTVSSMTEVFEACGVLFGPKVEISLDFLKYLQPSGLKAAYRKRALETHPDRVRIIGEDQTRMTEKFVEATQAYNKLVPVIRGNGTILVRRDANVQKDEKRKAERKPHQKTFSDHFYTGSIPRRELLIGQYLYYSGLISWNTLIKAILWQKRQRPRIGEIAVGWGMLSVEEIQEILISKRSSEKFGEYAAHKGHLTRFGVMALIGKQRRLQPPIGEYFLEKGILGPREMYKIVLRQRIHNRTVTQGRPR